jgi:hypothetical protein
MCVLVVALQVLTPPAQLLLASMAMIAAVRAGMTGTATTRRATQAMILTCTRRQLAPPGHRPGAVRVQRHVVQEVGTRRAPQKTVGQATRLVRVLPVAV